MRQPVTITPGVVLPASEARRTYQALRIASSRRRAAALFLGTVLAFGSVSAQLIRLAIDGQSRVMVSVNEPIAESHARPDIVDRNGRLLATDVEAPSLFADPALVIERDEVVEKLAPIFPDIDANELRRTLADTSRRFVWIKRGLSPKVAQRVHDLGIPGLSFRSELARAYPAGELAGHVIGAVNIDNKGVAGLERWIDETVGVEAVHGATLSGHAPVRLAIDMGVEHSLADELKDALERYRAKGAAGLVMDVNTGEMLASVSLPGVDPARRGGTLDEAHHDKISGGTYELGSIFKAMTIAMALDGGVAGLDSIVDVTQPLVAGGFTIADPHPLGRPMTVSEVFIHSSNVGAGLLALEVGAERQQAFLASLGLLQPMKTEAGPVATPLVPQHFDRTAEITVSYGHGLAVAPIQFAAAAAALVNGGTRIEPTFVRRPPDKAAERVRLVKAETSRQITGLMRLNVTDPSGTGKRADVPGLAVGGKTGTAEMAGGGGYREKDVISSFLAAFPADQPKYLVLVSVFEPKGTAETNGQVTAAVNAAPLAGRVIGRIAPLLGVFPDGPVAAVAD